MDGVELCQRHHRTLGRRIAGCRHALLSLTALLKPLASARMTYEKTHGNCIGNNELLLSKLLSSQLVLLPWSDQTFIITQTMLATHPLHLGRERY